MHWLYNDGNTTINCADDTDGTPSIKDGLFDKMAKRIYDDKEFKPEQLSEPEFVDIITDTYRVITKQLHQTNGKKQLADSYVKQEISPELTAALEQNAFMFAGFKIFHEASEIADNLKGDDGGFKPFSTFLKETKNIDETYNKHYLRAEYNFATQSTLSAIKWKEFEKDGDRYNLQYRTANDTRVREEHAALHNKAGSITVTAGGVSAARKIALDNISKGIYGDVHYPWTYNQDDFTMGSKKVI